MSHRCAHMDACIYICIWGHTQCSNYSDVSAVGGQKQFSKTHCTSQTEWHSGGACGYRGWESELFSFLWWAPFSRPLWWECTLVRATLHPSSLANDTKGSLSVSARFFLYISVVGMFVTIGSASPCYCICSSEEKQSQISERIVPDASNEVSI